MMFKFYYYIVAAELVENPYTTSPAVDKANFSLYSNEGTVGEPRTASRGENIFMGRVDSESKVFLNAASA